MLAVWRCDYDCVSWPGTASAERTTQLQHPSSWTSPCLHRKDNGTYLIRKKNACKSYAGEICSATSGEAPRCLDNDSNPESFDPGRMLDQLSYPDLGGIQLFYIASKSSKGSISVSLPLPVVHFFQICPATALPLAV